MKTDDDLSIRITAMFQAVQAAEIRLPRNCEARLPDRDLCVIQGAPTSDRQVDQILVSLDLCLDECRVTHERQPSEPRPEQPRMSSGLGQRAAYWARFRLGWLFRSSSTPFSGGAAKAPDL